MEKMEQSQENVLENPIEKLSSLLAEHLDKKVILTQNQYGNSYGLAELSSGQPIIDPAVDSETVVLLTDLYNQYRKNFTLDTANDIDYKQPDIDSEKNAVTPEMEQAASFTLRDFLEDMKSAIESNQ